MKTTLKLLVLSQLLIVSTASMAEETLTARSRCNDSPVCPYPGTRYTRAGDE